jgi:hypothetical protein
MLSLFSSNFLIFLDLILILWTETDLLSSLSTNYSFWGFRIKVGISLSYLIGPKYGAIYILSSIENTEDYIFLIEKEIYLLKFSKYW